MSIYEEFYVNSIQDGLKALQIHGVAVFPKVLEKDEVAKSVDEMWSLVEDLTQDLGKLAVKRDTPSTYINWMNMGVKHGMLMQHFGVGQSQCLWNIRQNPKVVEIFAQLWSTEPRNMLASFDGFSLSMPPELTGGIGWYSGVDWLHVDQGPKKPGFRCWQGMVTLQDVNEGDATLRCVPGSHQYHSEFFETFNKQNRDGDWYQFKKKELDWFLKGKGLKTRLVKAKAGDLILWDSRLIHCGSEPVFKRAEPNFRMVAYTSYLPRLGHVAAPYQLEEKQRALRDLKTTSHWAITSRVFKDVPHSNDTLDCNKVRVVSQVPDLSPLGARLAGFRTQEHYHDVTKKELVS